jgi:hypothetical protein
MTFEEWPNRSTAQNALDEFRKEKREQLSKRIRACIVWHEVNHTTLGDVTNDIMKEIEKQWTVLDVAMNEWVSMGLVELTTLVMVVVHGVVLDYVLEDKGGDWEMTLCHSPKCEICMEKREQLKQRIIEIIGINYNTNRSVLLSDEEIAERIMKEIEKQWPNLKDN